MRDFICGVAVIAILLGAMLFSIYKLAITYQRSTESASQKSVTPDTSTALIDPMPSDPTHCSVIREISKGQQELQRTLRASGLMNSPSGRASVAKSSAAVECARLGVEAYCEGKDAAPCP